MKKKKERMENKRIMSREFKGLKNIAPSFSIVWLKYLQSLPSHIKYS
jgi:hypothetical protein